MPRSDHAPPRLRTALICHADSRLNRDGIARWLASFSDLAGVVVIEETGVQARARIRREVRRVGMVRFLDVLAFRLYYRAFLASADAAWLRDRLVSVAACYGAIPDDTDTLTVADPNAPEVEQFLGRLAPDLVLARCKRILKERIFAIPPDGTFVLHPGVCPEYRNAHGAFWALARGDLQKVGLTLLRIDKGVDTGPVYGYYTYPFDEVNESHIVIMTRLALDNLNAIRDRLLEVHAGIVQPVDTSGRTSGVWGQPWLTRYLKWKRDARRRRDASALARVP